MKRAIAVVFFILCGFLGGWGFNRWYTEQQAKNDAAKSGRKILYWHDPMHPWYKSDKPGIAPDCNMPLEPVYADEPAAAAQQAERKVLYYRDPKDPNYRSDKPGLNPATGNDLEPVYDEPAPGTVQVSAEKQQLIGVRFGTVEAASATRTFRTVGRVAIDETKIVRVHPRVEGWIERVHVDYTGDYVKQGEPLLTLYSPEMLASQQEYLLALRGAKVLKESPVPDADRQASALIEASRRRLELFDLSEAQVQQVAATGKPIRDITLFAPTSGFVMARNAFPKQRVMPETELYQIADLSRVWIMADVFEAEAASVRMGQTATVRLPYGGRTFTARVTHILPTVDPQTRTLKVRLEAANPGTELKPDMYVDVDFTVGGGERLTVPGEAVINTGTRQTVYIDRGNGQFEPRSVQTGEQVGDRIVVVSGLKAGERVVTSGNFLIDSESQLRNPGAVPPAGGHVHQQPAAQPAPSSGEHKHD
jgi:RND family efflux transporter MFP subunit